jgi:hypothetical protein
MHPSELKRHLETNHPNMAGKFRDVSHTVTVIAQTLAGVAALDKFRSSGASRI